MKSGQKLYEKIRNFLSTAKKCFYVFYDIEQVRLTYHLSALDPKDGALLVNNGRYAEQLLDYLSGPSDYITMRDNLMEVSFTLRRDSGYFFETIVDRQIWTVDIEREMIPFWLHIHKWEKIRKDLRGYGLMPSRRFRLHFDLPSRNRRILFEEAMRTEDTQLIYAYLDDLKSEQDRLYLYDDFTMRHFEISRDADAFILKTATVSSHQEGSYKYRMDWELSADHDKLRFLLDAEQRHAIQVDPTAFGFTPRIRFAFHLNQDQPEWLDNNEAMARVRSTLPAMRMEQSACEETADVLYIEEHDTNETLVIQRACEQHYFCTMGSFYNTCLRYLTEEALLTLLDLKTLQKLFQDPYAFGFTDECAAATGL